MKAEVVAVILKFIFQLSDKKIRSDLLCYILLFIQIFIKGNLHPYNRLTFNF